MNQNEVKQPFFAQFLEQAQDDQAQAVGGQHDHAVEPEVGGLAHEVQPVAALRREDGLGRGED